MNLWMRWVNFRALRDLLLLVEANPHGLRAGELARIATEEGVLLSRSGQALGLTSHYHHRRTLERLGLLTKREQRLVINAQSPETDALTARTALGEELDAHEKEAFANAVLRNEDCHDVFFGSFLRSRSAVRSVAAFVECAQPIELRIQPGRLAAGERRGGRECGATPHPRRSKSRRDVAFPTRRNTGMVRDTGHRGSSGNPLRA